MESTIKLMESMFKLMENPIIVTTIEGVIWGLNQIINGGILFTDWLDKNLVPMIKSIKQSYDDDLKPVIDTLSNFFKDLTEKIDTFFESYALNLDNIGKKIKEVIDLLNIDLAGALEIIQPYLEAFMQILKDITGIDLQSFFDKIYLFFTGTDSSGNRRIEA
jgi:hypothetical protein